MKKIFWLTLILVLSFFQNVYSKEKIAFIDIDKIINESNFGKKSFKKIDDSFEKEKKNYFKLKKN